jgi:general secretion pathway protein D
VVNDGSIVVLGGLLQDTYQGGQEKVPGLGNLPVLGNLFRAETRSRSKTNLMIFLRPVVIRDGASSESLSLDRYESMRSAQRDIQPVPSTTVPINSAPVLPPQLPTGTTPLTPAPMSTLPPPPPAMAVPSVVQ